MRISIAALIGASLSPFLVHSQSSDAVPAFEVVSVKPSTALGHYGIGIFPYPGGRVEASFCAAAGVGEDSDAIMAQGSRGFNGNDFKGGNSVGGLRVDQKRRKRRADERRD